MIVKTYPLGSLQTNCYIAIDEDTNKAAIIDPGAQANYLIKEIEALGINIDVILLTHCHFDHDGAVTELKDKYKVDVYLNEAEEEYMNIDTTGIFGKLPKFYKYFNEGQEIKVGNLTFKTIFTPGHTKGGTCFLVEDNVFTGDTLFNSSIGRTDFLGGSYNELINSIETKLMTLDNNVNVYPGHGPKSTIIHERMKNPFLV
ncbi:MULTISPECIES: MBL fold metallo-hydrolase [unclassified Clostridium]|jgi:metallo-beta-lactamase|uniref:MBL fold metallo-hydrolase n=1 Tax=unclassified Clostridium TaxID=2614128 RepID=UPI0025C0B3EC|nr:MBL fold metallo-hydrolase [Clostridium sp.]MCI6693296.1 MBL fold metallo-hydrolase [Clostridium sp.]MDY2631099.1 MBL fold metallo-hydrolase [Clostridium sp.]MDY4251825.1 MBL fold metallo-hydrolase [Clostridium sp.]MDY6227842.1 MBL fold metallo-hydrolase [Clostridium sp.]